MGPGDLLPPADVSEHDAGADDMLQIAAGLFDGIFDDLWGRGDVVSLLTYRVFFSLYSSCRAKPE